MLTQGNLYIVYGYVFLKLDTCLARLISDTEEIQLVWVPLYLVGEKKTLRNRKKERLFIGRLEGFN